MQEIKMDLKSCDFIKVSLKYGHKVDNDKRNRNVKHSFQEEEYLKLLILNFKTLKYQVILTYVEQAKSISAPKECKKL